MLHVGLTGGLASGKSVVGRELERLGCWVIRMDDLGHQVLAPDGEAYAPVVAAFGSGILNEDRTIDRRALGRLVFADPEKLKRLNSLVHPAILARAKAMAEEHAREHPEAIIITEAAIMIETGSYKNYDFLIVAACRPEQQVERALARPNALSRAEVLDRMSRQIPIEEKVKYADYVIDTSGSEESTLLQTRGVFNELQRSMDR